MRIGFYTYSYIDRNGMEPADVIPRVAAAGYQALDISATWRLDEDPGLFPAERRREFRKLAADHGLTIEAAVTHLGMLDSLRDGRPINLPGAIDVAAEVGCPVVTFHIGSPAQAEGGDDWRRAVEYLQECCEYGGRNGVRLASDAIWPGTLLDTPESVVRLTEAVGSPWLGHNYDPCYLALCDRDYVAAAHLLGPQIFHAHIKDHVGRYPTWEHRIPGEGEMDYAACFRALGEVGFGGAVAVECFTDMPLELALSVGRRTMADAERAAAAE